MKRLTSTPTSAAGKAAYARATWRTARSWPITVGQPDGPVPRRRGRGAAAAREAEPELEAGA